MEGWGNAEVGTLMGAFGLEENQSDYAWMTAMLGTS